MKALKWEPLADFYARADAMPEEEWLIEQLVPGSGRLALIAAPNAGKTWAALVIAVTAALQGRSVLLVLEEGGVKQTAERFKALRFPADLNIRIVHLGGVKLREPATLSFLSEALRSAEKPVLILDPLSSIFDGDENSTEQMNTFKGQLEHLMRENEQTLLVILHHTSKGGEREGASPVYAGRGSSIMAGWVDAQLNLTHVAAGRRGLVSFDITVAKMREGERGIKRRVAIELGAENGISIEEVTANADTGVRDRIIGLFRNAIAPMSKSAISKIVKGRRADLFAVVDELVKDGTLEKVSGGFRAAQPTAPVNANEEPGLELVPVPVPDPMSETGTA